MLNFHYFNDAKMGLKKKVIILVILFIILYLWAELGVGIFYQESWGGD
jgi:hypothetical protein